MVDTETTAGPTRVFGARVGTLPVGGAGKHVTPDLPGDLEGTSALRTQTVRQWFRVVRRSGDRFYSWTHHSPGRSTHRDSQSLVYDEEGVGSVLRPTLIPLSSLVYQGPSPQGPEEEGTPGS